MGIGRIGEIRNGRRGERKDEDDRIQDGMIGAPSRLESTLFVVRCGWCL